MYVPDDLERWRDRRFEEYQRAQIVDTLDRQRLAEEYRSARVYAWMEQQTTGISELTRPLAGVESELDVLASDMARFVAVSWQTLPALVEHLRVQSPRC
ncbi:MAG: hypothetical protein ACXV3F_11240 [Frankiaceae bacterium]